MTARDTWEAARSALAAKRALIEAASPGEWFALTASGPVRRKQQHAVVGLAAKRGQGEAGALAVFSSIDGRKADNADLCAAAVNDYLPLLDIADGVLDEHRPSHILGARDACIACKNFPAWPCLPVRPVLTFAGGVALR